MVVRIFHTIIIVIYSTMFLMILIGAFIVKFWQQHIAKFADVFVSVSLLPQLRRLIRDLKSMNLSFNFTALLSAVKAQR